MTDLVTPAGHKLTPYRDGNEERDVIASAIRCQGFAGGFKSALAVRPVEIHEGDEVTLTIRAVCTFVGHDRIEGSDIDGKPAMRRIQTLKPIDDTAGLIIPDEVVAEQYRTQAEQARLDDEMAAGIVRLGFGEEGPLDLDDGDGD